MAVCSGVASGAFGSTGFAPDSAAGAGVASGLISMIVGLGVGASDSINFRRVHFAFALMNSTMRLMFSETGVVSRSRNCGRATLTCVTVLFTLKNDRP